MPRLGRTALIRSLNSLLELEQEHGRQLAAGQDHGYLVGLSDGRAGAYRTLLRLLGDTEAEMVGSLIGLRETAEAGILARLGMVIPEDEDGNVWAEAIGKAVEEARANDTP